MPKKKNGKQNKLDLDNYYWHWAVWVSQLCMNI